VGAHRRAVALRAARAHVTVVADSGIGAHVAGDAVNAPSARSQLDAGRRDSGDCRVAIGRKNVRGARSNDPIPHPRASRSATTKRHCCFCPRRRTRWTCGWRADDDESERIDGPSLRREGSPIVLRALLHGGPLRPLAEDRPEWKGACYHGCIGEATICSPRSLRRRTSSTEGYLARGPLSQKVPGDDRCCSHSSSLVADPWAARDSRCRFARSLFAF